MANFGLRKGAQVALLKTKATRGGKSGLECVQVHTGFKVGDNMYLKIASLRMEKSIVGLVVVVKDIQGRMKTLLQYLEGGGGETSVPKYCCKD